MSRPASVVSLMVAVVAACASGTVRAAPLPAVVDAGIVPDAAGAVQVLVELAGEPAVESYLRAQGRAGGGLAARAEAVSAARSQEARVEAAQTQAIAAFTSPDIGATVLFSVRRLYDGVAVRASAASLDRIAALPGVKAVHALQHYRLANAFAVPLIAAPRVWAATGPDLTGRGVRVGIIDSGIDYLHKDFGGTGSYGGQAFDDNDWPHTDKVVGGYDFVGDDYDGTNQAEPDGDPMDCRDNGHGTHVAGIVAGYGVTAGGETFAGPYGPDIDFAGLALGPGVAPEAELYALRVFGCSGTTGYVLPALDWAMDPNGDGDYSDHLDVVNLSLGSEFGRADDGFATAVELAVRAGVVVVAAAGNDGDAAFITSSPGSADAAVSVAASDDPAAFTGTFVVTAPAGIAGAYASTEAAFGPNVGFTASVSGALAYPSSDQEACSPFGATGSEIAGKVALLDRGECNFVNKVQNAQDAGAVAVLVVDNVPGELLTMGPPDGYDDSVLTIPAMLTTLETGATLKDALATGTVSIRMSAADRSQARTIDPTRTDALASFSSRGPRLGDLALKPDLSGPGVTIFSAQAGSGRYGIAYSGTSMATPMVSGTLAILRQLHPDWTPQQLKALVMNTATHDLWRDANHQGPRESGARVGAGRVDVEQATESDVVAYASDAPERVSLSFGSLEIGARTTLDRSLTLTNKGSLPASYSVAYDPVVTVPGVEVSLPGDAPVTVPAGAQISVPIRLSADPQLMRHTHDPTLTLGTVDEPARFWMSEVSGNVVLTPNEGPELRVPVYAAVRPTSSMAAREAVLPLSGPAFQSPLHLEGHDLDTGGTTPEDVRSLVTPLEWQGGSGFSVTAVGVASDFPAAAASVSSAVVAFGVSCNTSWTTPLDQTAAPQVELDTDGDGVPEEVLTISDAATVDPLQSAPGDAFVTVLCPASGCTGDDACPGGTGACAGVLELPLAAISPAQTYVPVFNTDTVVLAARAADLGLSSASSTLHYRVHAGRATTSFFTFDVAHPGVTFGAAPGRVGPVSFLDEDGGSIPVTLDRVHLQATGSRGVVLLHLHNGVGARAQTLEVSTTGCSFSCSTAAPDSAAPGEEVPFAATAVASGCGGDPAFSWSFGDGTPGSAAAASSHVYAAAGTYRWGLTVTSGGHSCVRSGFISVSGPSTHRAARVIHHPR